MSEESIYNLIPPQSQLPSKQPMYHSKFDPKLSQPVLKKTAATMGKPLERPDPRSFLKKGERSPSLPEAKKFAYQDSERKPAVPKKDEKPPLASKSDKNFITANAVENILLAPKKPEPPVDWTRKKDFGKVPDYLKKVKDQIHSEYRYIKEMETAQKQNDTTQVHVLSEEERQQILRGLKIRWEKVNTEYQTISFTLDTISKKARKEELEIELEELERNIEKMSRLVLVVPD